MWLRAAVALAGLLGVAMAQAPVSDEGTIRALRAESNAALKRHDLAKFGETLDTDFVMVRGSSGFVPTRQAYLDTFAEDFKKPQSIGYERVVDSIEISEAAPLAAEHGHWVGTHADGSQAYGGTYLAMWRKGAGGWKIRSELFVVLHCYDEASCAGYRKP